VELLMPYRVRSRDIVLRKSLFEVSKKGVVDLVCDTEDRNAF
jgi:hypothetical protein